MGGISLVTRFNSYSAASICQRGAIMQRHSLAIPLFLFGILLSINTRSQGQATVSSTQINVPGLNATTLNTPAPPSGFSTVNCSGTSTTYSYAVAALDFTGASTPLATGANYPTNCPLANLSRTSYIYFNTFPVAGSQSCNVFRTVLPSGTTYLVGNVPCGSIFYDFNLSPTQVPTPGPNNYTGGINTPGTVAASVFNASNASGFSGTTILTQETSPVPSCATNPPPCITSGNEFFLTAPTSTIAESWGITVPTNAPMAPGAFLLSAGSGTNFLTTTAGVSGLTNSSWTGTGTPPVLATVSGTLSNFKNGDLVSVAVNSPNIDITDSGITLSGTQIPYANETIPTFDSQTGFGLSQPSGNGSFIYPTSTGINLALSGTQPSIASTGASAGTLLSLSGAQGGNCNGTSCNGGVGQSVAVTTGSGGTATPVTGNGTGGQGGNFTIMTGNGGSATSGSSPGGAGGGFAVTSGNGGTSAGSGANSNGGNVTFTLGKAGTGGSGSAGNTGQFQVTGTGLSVNPGANGYSVGTLFDIIGVLGGGTSSTGATGGTGSAVLVNSGGGGSGSGTNNGGGLGGAIGVTAGNGGTATGTGVGGTGGTVTITAGSGGNAASGGTNGSGGNIVFATGSPGSIGTGGSAGIIEALISGTQILNFLSLGLLSGSGEELGWSSSAVPGSTFDTGFGRAAAGVVSVDTTTNGNAAGLLLSSNTAKVIGANYTNQGTTPTTIIGNTGNGLSWALPASTNWSFNCNLVYQSTTTGATRPELSLYFAYSSTPKSFMANAEIYTNSSTTTTLVTSGTANSGSSPVLVLTGGPPNASGSSGTCSTGNCYIAIMYGGVEMNTAGTISIQAAESGGSMTPTITILRGSYCQLF